MQRSSDPVPFDCPNAAAYARHRRPFRRGLMALIPVLLIVLGHPLSASGQVDTTAAPQDAAPTQPDSAQQAQPDSLRRQGESFTPLSFPVRSRGRTPLDSLPIRTPLVGFEHMLAQAPGSFLYDLGAVGWPHGWSPHGLAPHRSHLWLNGHPYDDPLLGRARFDLLPPSFLTRPEIGADLGGGATAVQTDWRNYPSNRPVTELRFRRDNNGQKAIEVAHSQRRRFSLLGSPSQLHLTFGYGGRTTSGAYAGSDLRRERRIWGRLRFQRDDWAVELSDLSSRHRIGAHGGVVPPRDPFETIYLLPLAERSVRNPEARRRTFRNDLTARVRGPLVPGLSSPLVASTTWTSQTFDFQTGATADTTWTVKMNGGHAHVRQPLALGAHNLTLGLQGSAWSVARSNVPQIEGSRWSAHAYLRDSVSVGAVEAVLQGGWHQTQTQQYPSATGRISHTWGPLQTHASAALSSQRPGWIDEHGFSSLVRPLPESSGAPNNRLLKGTIGTTLHLGILDVGVEGFAHKIQNAFDLYAVTPTGPTPPSTIMDTVAARRTPRPLRRAGATVSIGLRKDARRGLYAVGRSTALQTLNADASVLHARQARALPTVFGQGRIGARFVLFKDLITDLYVQARGWTALNEGWNSRWFHAPTGRFAVPPLNTPIPSAPNRRMGTGGTVDVHAEMQLRGATLFFTFENVQASSEGQLALQLGTFVVPVYPLPARQFRFGVFWPIFD